MIGKLQLIIIISNCCIIGTVFGIPCLDTTDDNNNDQDSAVALNLPKRYTGVLCSRVEKDWFTLTPDFYPVQVFVNVTYESESGDISLSVLQKDGKTTSSAGGFGFEFVTVDLLSDHDDTFIKITSKDDWKKPLQYTLHVVYTAPNPCDDYFEPNNDFDHTTNLGFIAENYTVVTALTCESENDYYTFIPERDGRVFIYWRASTEDIEYLHTAQGITTRMELYNTTHGLLTSLETFRDQTFLKWDVLGNHIYYIKLSGADSTAVHMYRIQFRLEEHFCEDVVTENTTVSFPTVITGRLCESSEQDTYLVTVYEGAKFEIIFNSDNWQSYPVITVNKVVGTTLEFAAQVDSSILIPASLLLGIQTETTTYQIAVQNQYFISQMDYELSLLDVTCANDGDFPATTSMFTAPGTSFGEDSTTFTKQAVMCADEEFMYYAFNITQGGDLTVVVNYTSTEGQFDWIFMFQQMVVGYYPSPGPVNSIQFKTTVTDAGTYYLQVVTWCCVNPAGERFTINLQWQPTICSADFQVPTANEVVALTCQDLDYQSKLFYGVPGTAYNFSCPSGCQNSNTTVIGNKIYSTYSSICSAAIHAGVLTNQGGQAQLIRQDYLSYFVGSTQHSKVSISSSTPAPAFSFQEYIPDHCIKNTYSYGNIAPIPLADLDATSFVIHVTDMESLFVQQVIVYAKVVHPLALDLSMYLNGPSLNQQTPVLVSIHGDPGCNGLESNLDNWFSVSALNMESVSEEEIPFKVQGHGSPYLAEFVGTDANGAWELIVVDNTGNGITGSLITWQIQIYACEDVCGDSICTSREVATCPLDCDTKYLPHKMPDINSCRMQDSQVYCWGDNTYGQIGQGNTLAGNDLGLLAPVSLPSEIKSFTGGSKFVCANSEFNLYCWGLLSELHNEYDIIGDESGEYSVSMSPASTKFISKVALGFGHMCILYATGELSCLGENTDGQCGSAPPRSVRMSSTDLILPVIAIDPAYQPVEMAVGKRHTCVILSTRYDIKCWGHVAAGIGRQTAGGTPSTNPTVTFPYKLTSLCAGSDFTCALTFNGSVLCWGSIGDNFGYSTNDTVVGDNVADFAEISFISTPDNDTVVTLSCAASYACGLLSSGIIHCWGSPDFIQSNANFAVNTLFDGTKTITEIASGQDHTCVVYSDARMACWGSNTAYQLGAFKEDFIGTGDVYCTTEIISKSKRTVSSFHVGYTHACGIVESHIKCFGDGSYGQLGNRSPQDIGDKVFSVGPNLKPVQLYPLGTWTKVVTGVGFTCALGEAVKVEFSVEYSHCKCWGKSDKGQLALEGSYLWTSSLDPSLLPAVRLGFLPTDICAGDGFVCVTTASGSVACWGANEYGQLGRGDTENIGDDFGEMDNLVFVPVPPVTQLICGSHHVCVVVNDSTANFGRLGYSENQPWEGYPNPLNEVEHIGDDPNEISGLPPVTIEPALDNKVIQLGCGEDHCCAILPNNRVKCWGSNQYGQLGTLDRNPSFGKWMEDSPSVPWSEAQDITVGRYHNCLKMDHQFICWGKGDSGELGFSVAADQGSFGAHQEDEEFTFTGMPPGEYIRAMYAGDSVTCVISVSENLVCWGAPMIVDVFSNTPPQLTDVIPMGSCPAGFSSESSYSCTCCSPGTYKAQGDTNPQCSLCKAGTISGYGQDHCTLCPLGHYQSITGSPVCLSCEPGTYSNVTGATTCNDCPRGTAASNLGTVQCEECTEGYFSASTRASLCEVCSPGTFTNISGASACLEADRGYLVPGYGYIFQEQCEPGSFTPQSGAHTCVACSSVTFSNASGSTECLACPSQSFSKDTNGTLCLCKDGMFMKNSECLDCPFGAVCFSGLIQRAKLGYWQSRLDYTHFYACPNPNVCLPNGTCAEGYEGPTCAVCSQGYSMSNGYVCTKCPSRSQNGLWIAFFVVAVVAGGGVSLFKILKKLMTALQEEEEEELERAEDMAEQQANEGSQKFTDKVQNIGNNVGNNIGTGWIPNLNAIDWKELKDLVDVGKVKILVGFLQVFSQLDATYDVPWPRSFVDFVSKMSFINFDFIDLTSSDCVQGTPKEAFYTEFLIMIFAPFLLLIVLFLVMLAAVKYITRKNPATPPIYLDMYWHYVIFFVFLIYTGVSTKVLKIFRCTDIDGVDYLQADYTIECWTPKHTGMVALGVVMVLAYPLGIPAVSGLVLWINKKAVVDDSTIRAIERQKLLNEVKLAELQAKYSALFTKLDQDNSGELDFNEFKTVCDELEFQYRDQTVLTETFQEASGGTQKMSKTQFDTFLTSFLQKKIVPVRYTVAGAFKILDDNDQIDPSKICLEEERKRVQTRYGMLYNDYEPNSYMWEVWDMFRKLSLAGGMIFVARGTTIQIGIALLICVFSLVLHTHFKAYVENTTDMFQFGTLSVLTLTLFSGLLIKAQTGDSNSPSYENNALAGFLIFINGTILALAVALMAWRFLESAKKFYAKYKETVSKIQQFISEKNKPTERTEPEGVQSPISASKIKLPQIEMLAPVTKASAPLLPEEKTRQPPSLPGQALE